VLQAAKVKFTTKSQHNEVPPFGFDDQIEYPPDVLIASPGSKRCDLYRVELLTFYNSRLLRWITGPEWDRSMPYILDKGVVISRGIPMAQIED